MERGTVKWFSGTDPMRTLFVTSASLLALTLMLGAAAQNPAPTASSTNQRPRTRDLGIQTGILPTGPLDMITDVPGVEVGQVTLDNHKNIHTGVTAILPHPGNMFQHKVPGAVFVGNGFGKLMGSTQIRELGRIETPILLTSTLNVPRVADALLSYMMQLPGNEHVRSINPVVGETNDGYLNDIRGRYVDQRDVFEAIEHAHEGLVAEGSVGAGAGTVAFGFKGGIGTASRKLPANLGGWTVGVLVQTNFGGILNIDGAPVGLLLGRYYLKNQLHGRAGTPRAQSPDGSCMIIVATNAPVGSRNLRRMAKRAMFGLARTGSVESNGSGDYAIAFSAVPADASVARVHNRDMSPLFLAVIEATQEAIYNSLFKATTVTGRDGHTVEALPLGPTEKILREYHVIH